MTDASLLWRDFSEWWDTGEGLSETESGVKMRSVATRSGVGSWRSTITEGKREDTQLSVGTESTIGSSATVCDPVTVADVRTGELLPPFAADDAFREGFASDSRGSGIKDEPKLMLDFLAGIARKDLGLGPLGDLQEGEALPRETGVADPLRVSR